MPFVEGGTLRARLERATQLPPADAVRIAREVADALAEAPARGNVHRDIKPESILLQGTHALGADFDIALAVQHAGGARMTQTGLSLGTPHYMSPEQAMGERTIDARSDIYILGAVTYEMLLGVGSVEAGEPGVYVGSFPDMNPVRLVSGGGADSPRWSRSGRELFFESGGMLMTVAVPPGPTFAPGAPRPLFSLAGFRVARNRPRYDVAPGNQGFVMIREPGSAAREVVYVEHWFAELEERVRQ